MNLMKPIILGGFFVVSGPCRWLTRPRFSDHTVALGQYPIACLCFRSQVPSAGVDPGPDIEVVTLAPFMPVFARESELELIRPEVGTGGESQA